MFLSRFIHLKWGEKNWSSRILKLRWQELLAKPADGRLWVSDVPDVESWSEKEGSSFGAVWCQRFGTCNWSRWENLRNVNELIWWHDNESKIGSKSNVDRSGSCLEAQYLHIFEGILRWQIRPCPMNVASLHDSKDEEIPPQRGTPVEWLHQILPEGPPTDGSN